MAIFHYLKAPEGVPFLVKLVEECEGDPPEDVVEAICAIGPPALDPLLELFQRSGLEMRGAIALQLAGLGIRDSRLLDAFIGLLRDDPFHGALALGLYADPAAKPAVDEALAALQGEEEETVRLRRELEMCLREISGDIPRAEADEFDLFGLYPEEIGPAFLVLDDSQRLEFFSSPLARHRAEAAASFAGELLTDAVRDALLASAFSDAESEVRAACLRSLSEAAGQPPVKEKLLGVLEAGSVNLKERSAALVALADPDDVEILRPYIQEFYGNPATRADAMETMWRTFSPSFREYFPRHLEEKDPDVRRQAIIGLGYLGIGAESGKLTKFFEDEDFRDVALFAYALAVPGETKPSTVKHLLRKVEKVAENLSVGDTELVERALDQRLIMHGHDPVFYPDDEHDEDCDCGHPH